MLSPDGAYIAANLSPGCGPSYSFLVPTTGSRAKPLAGGAHGLAKGAPSRALGWTHDTQVAVVMAQSGTCESESKSGIYLVDPRTLTRRFIYPRASEMWGASYG